jgi:raffinose/stachyose/melibiose transport system substrate-binding protein
VDEQGSARIDRRELLRRGAVGAAAAGVLGSSAGQALAGTSARAASAGVELWHWQAGNAYPDIFAAAGKRWSAKSGGKFHQTSVPYNSYWAKFKTAVAGGSTPDVMEMSWTGQYHDLIKAKTLAPLDPALKKGFPAFFQTVMDSLAYQGKHYAIPLDLNTLTIAYNKNLFAKLHLKVPKTLDELIALAKPIRDAGFQPLSVNVKDGWPDGDLWFAQVAYTDPTGQAIRRAETGAIPWTAAPFLRAAENVQKMKAAGLFADGSDATDFNGNIAAFATGQVAMTYPHGNFSTGIIAKAVGSKFAWDLFPFPPLKAGAKPLATGGPAIIWSIPAKAKNPEGALDFMRDTTDKIGFAALVKENFIPSAKASVASNPSAIYRRMVSFQPTAATRAIFVPAVYTALLNEMQALVGGSSKPQNVVSAMQKAAKSAK